jgi:ParB family chromosome partitioning protein
MRQSELLTLPLTAIAVEGRLREVDPRRAEELAISLREAGQITPVEVGPVREDGRHKLIVGAHRVAAARLAGLQAIQAIVYDGTPDQERLREIDENLYRRELSPLDQATFLAERRAIYERVVGPVKAGRRNRANFAQLDFFDDVARKFGFKRRLVQLALWRRNTIAPDAWSLLAGTKHAEKGSTLDAIARLAPELQLAVVKLLVSGAAKTVRTALGALGVAPVVDPDAQQLQALASAWKNAGPQARDEFLRILVGSHGRAISAILTHTPATPPAKPRTARKASA